MSVRRWLWLGPLLASMLLPFAWMVMLSIAPQAGDSFSAALRGPWGLDHYRALFEAAGVWRYLLNSVVVAVVVVTLNVVTAAMAGYVLGRRRVAGERFWSLGVLATLMLPKQALMIPLYLVMARLHLLDSYAALILPFAVDAFSIFLVRQAVTQIPLELEEAARVDGASDWSIFRTIILPVLGWVEKTKPLPNSIAESILNPTPSAGTVSK